MSMYDPQPACPKKYFSFSASVEVRVTHHFVGMYVHYDSEASFYFAFKIQQKSIHKYYFFYFCH